MASQSSQLKIDCSICKVTFDEDHGVWVCLECTEKLTNAIHQASISPPLTLKQIKSQPLRRPERGSLVTRRSSLPEKQNISMTLFLELTNNGNKRRFKYKPYDLHRNISLLSLQECLLRRFAHDLELKHLDIASQSIFEINDKGYQHEFIIFESLHDLFDGAKMKINLNDIYYTKYKHSNMKQIRRRSKSASNISDDLKLDIYNAKYKDDDHKSAPAPTPAPALKIQMMETTNRVKNKHFGDGIVSPLFSDKVRNNVSFGSAYDSNSENVFLDQCIIIDNGSGLMKCGFGGLSDNIAPHGPQIVFPTTYVKDNIGVIEAISSLIRPIQRGFITNWKEMEYIWDDILNNKLSLLYGHNYDICEHRLLMTERYETPYKDREKLLQIMFESYNIPSLYLAHSASLSIYGTGRTKGVVLDIGEGVTSVISMFDNAVSTSSNNNNNNKVIEFGGYDLTMNIQKEYSIAWYYDAQKLKEEHYKIPYDRSDILFGDINTYALPDGTSLKLGKDRMINPLHLLFNEKYGGINVAHLVTNCVKQYNDENIEHILCKNIVLSGGSTMMNGFAERFAKEIKHSNVAKTQVLAGRSRRFLSWVGAVVMSSISTFKNISISRYMYQEHGPRIARDINM